MKEKFLDMAISTCPAGELSPKVFLKTVMHSGRYSDFSNFRYSSFVSAKSSADNCYDYLKTCYLQTTSAIL